MILLIFGAAGCYWLLLTAAAAAETDGRQLGNLMSWYLGRGGLAAVDVVRTSPPPAAVISFLEFI